MRILTGLFVAICGFAIAATIAIAQRQGEAPKGAADDLVIRMMAFDENKDGKLTKAEVTDERLHRLFDRADADKDGTVTEQELTTLATKERTTDRGGPPGFGPPGFGPPGGGPGGFMMRPPRVGEVLPPMFQQMLKITPEQKAQLDDLQKEVDAKLEKILSDAQRKQIKEMQERGPGRFGPPGGRRPGGPPPRGGPGGGPPPDDNPPPGERPSQV